MFRAQDFVTATLFKALRAPKLHIAFCISAQKVMAPLQWYTVRQLRICCHGTGMFSWVAPGVYNEERRPRCRGCLASGDVSSGFQMLRGSRSLYTACGKYFSAPK